MIPLLDLTWEAVTGIFTFLIFLALLIEFVWRRWIGVKLRNPIIACFLIPDSRFKLGYVDQDDREHFLDELVLPANSEVPVMIWINPKLDFHQDEIYFGMEGKDLRTKPEPTKVFNPFMIPPKEEDPSNPSHYRDWYRYYHIHAERNRIKDEVYVIGFMVKTKDLGEYPAQLLVHTPRKLGKARLKIRVESCPITRQMDCLGEPRLGRLGKFIKFIKRKPWHKPHSLKPKESIWQIELIRSIEREEHVRIKLTDTLIPYYTRLFDEICLPHRNIEKASKTDLMSTTYHEVGHAKAKMKREIDFFVILIASLVLMGFAFVPLSVLALLSPPFWGMFIVVYFLMLAFFLPLIGITALLPPIKGIFVGSVIFTLYLLVPIIIAPFSSFVIVLFGVAFSALFAASVRLEKSVSEWRADIFAVRKVGAEEYSKAKPWWTKAPRRKITTWQRFWFKILMPYYVCPCEKRISIISKHKYK